MSATQIPIWITIVGTLGIGSFIGTVISLWFTASQQHKNWVNDQKKAEYKELLDALYMAVTVISENRPNLSSVNVGPIGEASKNVSRIFEDRLFVGDLLKQSGATQDWYNMKKVIFYEPSLQSETPKEFWYSTYNLHEREDNLRKKILEIARKDIVAFRLFG
jgi:hypothetical protein